MWRSPYNWALALYVTIDIWLYHQATKIEDLILARR
jgi:hypothetical protein